jgi:serine/threonine protein kinase
VPDRDGDLYTAKPAEPERFDYRGEIGCGGMGSIYDVFDRALKRRVAMKVLHPLLAGSERELRSFVREARRTAKLEHPCIVPVHDVYSDLSMESASFVMKFVEGETLSQWIAREGVAGSISGRTLERALQIILKVCDAVAFAHAHEVLHLDLKPDNVMIGSHGEVYLMDWGISVDCDRSPEMRLKPRIDRPGARGTLSHMAPEQLEPSLSRVDERADVYGLGGLVYVLLTGQPPFVPTGAPEDLLKLREHRVPHPTQVSSQHLMPPGLVAIAMRALAADPADRYQTVGAFQSALEGFLRGGGWFATQVFPAGQELMKEGELGDAAYIIVEGSCDIIKGNGREARVVRTISAGDIVGETALLTSGTRNATVTAQTTVRALVVTRETLERELEGRGWLETLVRALARRFAEADQERTSLREQLMRRDSVPAPPEQR